MNIISVDKLTKNAGNKLLFKEISFGVETGEKIALVGVNGCGKTTLLSIIAGIESQDSGTISRTRDLKFGFLSQRPLVDPAQTIGEHIFKSDSPRTKIIKEYETVNEKLLKDSSSEALAEELHKLTEQIDALNAWDYEHEIAQMLSVLGIEDLTLKMSALSGGMLRKVSLAQTLIEDADLIILDEPTNHLDIETAMWLEEYLVKTTKAILMVTHDRYFLDKVCSKIIEIDMTKIFIYEGNYSYYLEKKDEIRQSIERNEERIESILRRELEWLKQGAKARTTKSKERINKISSMVNREKISQDDELEFSVSGRRLGKKILELKEISKSFGNNRVVDNFSHIFKKNEKIGITGKNGSGKSTFLNIITGSLAPDKGTIDKGLNTLFGYFDQNSKDINPDLRIIDYAKEKAELIQMSDGSVLTTTQMLEKFNFPPAMQYQTIGKLSGGEKRRLQLIKVLLSNPNFLILDEPTNDLDIKTLSVLENFLINYDGCLLIVSHDRYFLDRVADHILIFEENGKIKAYSGLISEYIFEKAKNTKESLQPKKPQAVEQHIKPRETEKKNKLSFKEKFEFKELEADIEKLEKEKSALETKLSEGTAPDIATAGKRYEALNIELDKKISRWAELAEKEE